MYRRRVLAHTGWMARRVTHVPTRPAALLMQRPPPNRRVLAEFESPSHGDRSAFGTAMWVHGHSSKLQLPP
jgi:hypothetical protein